MLLLKWTLHCAAIVVHSHRYASNVMQGGSGRFLKSKNVKLENIYILFWSLSCDHPTFLDTWFHLVLKQDIPYLYQLGENSGMGRGTTHRAEIYNV